MLTIQNVPTSPTFTSRTRYATQVSASPGRSKDSSLRGCAKEGPRLYWHPISYDIFPDFSRGSIKTIRKFAVKKKRKLLLNIVCCVEWLMVPKLFHCLEDLGSSIQDFVLTNYEHSTSHYSDYISTHAVRVRVCNGRVGWPLHAQFVRVMRRTTLHTQLYFDLLLSVYVA